MSLPEVNHFITSSNRILGQFGSLISDHRCLLKEWDVELSDVQRSGNFYEGNRRDIANNIIRLRNNSLKFVVFGRVSTGKSALINALLTKEVLPSYARLTTNSFIEIRASLDESNYVIFPDSSNERREISHINVVDEFSEGSLEAGSHVDLYYSSKECPLLREGVVIVDTPGIDWGLNMNDDIQRECEGADVIILVVSSECGLGECERHFVINHRIIFSNLNLMIVFTKWDKIHSRNESWCRNIRRNYSEKASQLLSDHFQIGREEAARRIHFLSARERLDIISNDTGEILAGRDIINQNFDIFFRCLMDNLNEHSTVRRRRQMKGICQAMEVTFGQMPSRIITSKKICDKVSENLSTLNKSISLKKSIISEIDAVFEVMFEVFFSNALRVVKLYREEDESAIEYRLKCVLMESLIVAVESTKVRIRDGVSNSDLPNKDYIMKILEIFYIPVYLDLSNEAKINDMKTLRILFQEVYKKIRFFSGIAIGGATVGSAAVLAAVGATAGILAPISTAIFTPLFVTLGVGAGGGTAGGLSFALLKRRALEPRYKEYQDKIEEMWKMEKERFTKSFYKLNLDVNGTVKDLMKPLDSRFINIGNELLELRKVAKIT